MKTLFHINYDEDSKVCEADFLEDDFEFNEDLVAGIISTIIYTFTTALPERDKEQFMAKLADLISEDFKSGYQEENFQLD